jgi:hypothetical protein
MMTRRATWRGRAITASVGLLLLLAGCRQPDGTMPTPTEEQKGRIADIARDLQNVAEKSPDGPQEFMDDLANLDSASPPAPRIKELGDSLIAAVSGKVLLENDASRMANLTFLVRVPADLSQAQINQIGSDLRETLMKVGADPSSAERASAAASALASEMTQNKRRWYHR